MQARSHAASFIGVAPVNSAELPGAQNSKTYFMQQ
jgi:hypothetical protein